VHRAPDLAAVAAEVAVAGAAVVAADECGEPLRSTNMKSSSLKATVYGVLCVVSVVLGAVAAVGATESHANPGSAAAAPGTAAGPQTFDSADSAAKALLDAAGKFDVPALIKIVGEQGEDLILTGEFAQDRERAQEFATLARTKKQVARDPKTDSRAFLLVGEEDWPFPLPIVKRAGRWSFDAAAGRQEMIWRRLGSNELDAIEVCHGFVEAQFDYAYRKRQEYEVAQYAQHVISSPGKQDGLAWQKADGSWDGPIGEKIAHAIEQGYDVKAGPYRGYFFKVLKGQGPDAPLGAMDYVVEGVMIGGFALVAAPAEYGESGLKTFMVSNTGVVYEKDLGAGTLDAFQKMDRFNPDKSWTIVED
jgi:hypothetical protein